MLWEENANALWSLHAQAYMFDRLKGSNWVACMYSCQEPEVREGCAGMSAGHVYCTHINCSFTNDKPSIRFTDLYVFLAVRATDQSMPSLSVPQTCHKLQNPVAANQLQPISASQMKLHGWRGRLCKTALASITTSAGQGKQRQCCYAVL